MSSGRGPGVVGLLMAVLVIGGFGAIYVFVFDKELQGGGRSIQSIIRENEDEIDVLKAQIEQNKRTLADSKEAAENRKIADELTTETSAVKSRIEELSDAMSKMVSDTVALEKEFLDYRTAYRSQIRSDAVGEKFDELSTVSGSSYSDVEIRDVTEVGISIRHRDGSKRITYEELTPEWQERFQFDPDEKAEALAREEIARQMYEKAISGEPEEEVVVAGTTPEQADTPEEPLPDPATAAGMDEVRRRVTAKEIQLARLKTQWEQLQKAAVTVQQQEGVERARGNSGMTKVNEMRQRIQSKDREIAQATRELHQLKRMQQQP